MQNKPPVTGQVDLGVRAERRYEAAAAAVGAVEVMPDADELHRLTQATRAALEALEAAILPPVIVFRPRA